MDNAAFRKLLNSDGNKSKGQSTKEYAREVVELEYKERRQKRGRDEDYLSDDDDDDGGDDRKATKRDERKQKKQQKIDDELAAAEERKAKKKQDKKDEKLKYRDRARERREGKSNVDYHDSKDISSNVDEEMSKYLGGDEEHTHLVRGLDKTLSEKVRRDEMLPREPKEEDIDLDKIMEEASSARAREAKKMSTKAKSLEDLRPEEATPLSTGMLSYLKRLEGRKQTSTHMDVFGYKKAETVSQAGEAISRTTLKFSLDANVQNRLKSWELPEETMIAAVQRERMRNRASMTTCTPLDRSLITKIKAVFSSANRGASVSVATKKSKSSKKAEAETVATKRVEQIEASNENIDDSDDDIFGDIDDYVPPTAKPIAATNT